MFVVFLAGMPLRAGDTVKGLATDKLSKEALPADFEWRLPSDKGKLPFKDEKPIYFLSRNQNAEEWGKLPAFWNEAKEKARDPRTGEWVERPIVKIKVPLGLTQGPPIPAENPPTVPKWALGKQLYFDEVISSDNTVSCAFCHNPKLGYTTNTRVSTGIKGQLGGMNAPTVLNSAYNLLHFWDGRALSLEDQSQGPPQNPVEMFDGVGNAWQKVVERVRRKGDYTKRFQEVFGSPPTRDTIAKAIATYERTVLVGNSLHDRADLAMRKRVEDEESGKFDLKAIDYAAVLKDSFTRKDPALTALGVDPAKDAAKIPALAQSVFNGRTLFFNKARCNSCHVGDNFTDNQFHNLGVGVKDGQLPQDAVGRYARLPTGHKNPELVGAFKTPGLRGLLNTAPYMHDGSETTLEKVVDFYDKGGNANEFLDLKMRDYEAEKAYILSKAKGVPYNGAEVKVFGYDKKTVVPLKLNLTEQEKKDLVIFLKALQSDPVDPLVANPEKMPGSLALRRSER